MSVGKEREAAAERLQAQIEQFERDNPEFVRELEVLGMGIDEYENALAASAPRVVTGNASAVE